MSRKAIIADDIQQAKSKTSPIQPAKLLDSENIKYTKLKLIKE